MLSQSSEHLWLKHQTLSSSLAKQILITKQHTLRCDYSFRQIHDLREPSKLGKPASNLPNIQQIGRSYSQPLRSDIAIYFCDRSTKAASDCNNRINANCARIGNAFC